MSGVPVARAKRLPSVTFCLRAPNAFALSHACLDRVAIRVGCHVRGSNVNEGGNVGRFGLPNQAWKREDVAERPVAVGWIAGLSGRGWHTMSEHEIGSYGNELLRSVEHESFCR
ncbi:MAG: hypothetical protein ACP5QZ_02070 [Candidatus Sumerlaeaceae bacterium]